MTHAIALSGHWSGLRAIPRTLATPDHRRRLETGLERLSSLYETMSARAALLAQGMDRLDGLRSGMIDQLDAIDVATIDMEPSADFEPSLCGVRVGGAFMGSDDDLEDSADDHGEPSLSASLQCYPGDQSGARWIGGGDDHDLEGEHDGCEPDQDDEHTLGAHEGPYGTISSAGSDDREPSLAATHAIDQRLAWTAWADPNGPHATLATQDREDQCEDEGAQCDDEGAGGHD